MSIYAVTILATTAHRSMLQPSATGAPVFGAGRTSIDGQGWFGWARLAGGGIVTAQKQDVAGPNVVCSTRTASTATVRLATGSNAFIAAPTWPDIPTASTVKIDTSIVHTELWVGVAHTPDVQTAMLARLKARFL